MKIGNTTTVNLYQISSKKMESLQAYWSEFEFYELLNPDTSVNPVFLQLFCTGTIIYTWPGAEKSWNFICFEHHITIRDFLSNFERTSDNSAFLAAKVVAFLAELNQMPGYKLKPGALQADKIGLVLQYAPDNLTSVVDIKLKLVKPSTVLEKSGDGQSVVLTSEEKQQVQKDLGCLLLEVCYRNAVSELKKSKSSAFKTSKPVDELWSTGCRYSEKLINGEITIEFKDFIQPPAVFQGLVPAQWAKLPSSENNPSSSVNSDGFFTVSDVRYYNGLRTTLTESMKTLVLKSNEELENYGEVSCLKTGSEFLKPNPPPSPEPQHQVDAPVETKVGVENKRKVVYPWLLYVAGCHLYNHYLWTKSQESCNHEHLLAACACFSLARSECSRLLKSPTFQRGSVARELEQVGKNVEEKHSRASMLVSASLPNQEVPEWKVSEIKARIQPSPTSTELGGLVMADLALHFADTFWNEMEQLSAAEAQVYLQVLGGPYSDQARSLHKYLTSRL